MPQITTLLCTYRRPRLLARALASLAAQSCQDFVVRVFDNASGDQTSEVVAWFRRKGLTIDYHCHPENIGFERNFAFAMSQEISSEYVHILNDDDYVLERFFEIALGGFKAIPEAIFVSARIAHVPPDGVVVDIPLARWRKEVFAPGEGAACLIEIGHPELTAMLYKSAWLRESGGFDFQGYGLGSDVPFHVLAAAKYPIVICPELGGVFTAHPQQLSAVPLGEAQPVFGRMFVRLPAAAFPQRSHFSAVLRAAAERHIYVHRHRTAAPGLARELTGLRALAGLIVARPARTLDALQGYLDSMRDVLIRASRSPDDRLAERRAACATATAEIANFTRRLAAEFVDPCLAAVGLPASH